MLAFPGMLVGPAQEAGMKVPPDADKFNPNEYPHFRVYLNCQLGAAMPFPTAHWSNAVAGHIPWFFIMGYAMMDPISYTMTAYQRIVREQKRAAQLVAKDALWTRNPPNSP